MAKQSNQVSHLSIYALFNQFKDMTTKRNDKNKIRTMKLGSRKCQIDMIRGKENVEIEIF